MAIYHFSAQVISRSQGRSSVAASAYRSAEKLTDERTGLTHDYTKKNDVVHNAILLPDQAPDWMIERAALWNAVELIEKRKDAQLAREINIALPRELSPDQNWDLLKSFVRRTFVDHGMIADVAFHRGHLGGEEQPHGHVMLTMREVNADGFGQKVRSWNDKALLKDWREQWADYCNTHLVKHGFDITIDHRTLEAQGINLEAQSKIGPKAAQAQMARLAEHQALAERNGQRLLADPSIALHALTRQHSTFTHQDIARFVNRHTNDQDQFTQVFEAVKAHPDLVQLSQGDELCQRFTTRELLQLEADMMRDVQYQILSAQHPVNEAVIQQAVRGKGLSEEQQYALKHVTQRADLACIVGFAGTGKSYLLGTARQAWEQAGYRVQGMTLSGIAAENLSGGSGIECHTVANRLWRWAHDQERLTAQDIVVVDEAGMLGSRQMAGILKEVHRVGAKVILLGDPEQLQAIEAGSAFRAIVEQIGCSELSDIRRQHISWQQQATRDFATLKTHEGLGVYHQHGYVHACQTQQEAAIRLVEHWDEMRQQHREQSHIMLAYTRDHVQQLNERARLKRFSYGELGNSRTFETERGQRQFAEQDRVYFLRNDYRELNVKNGTLGTIQTIEGDRLTVQLDATEQASSRSVTVNIKDYPYLDYGYAATVHKAQGVTVDRSYVLASRYLDRHSTYVAMSRHRQHVNLYYGQDDFPTFEQLARTLSLTRQKDVTLDYTVVEPQQPSEKASLGLREQVMRALGRTQVPSSPDNEALLPRCDLYQKNSLEAFKAQFEARHPERVEALSRSVLPESEQRALSELDEYRRLNEAVLNSQGQEKVAHQRALSKQMKRMASDQSLVSVIQQHEPKVAEQFKALQAIQKKKWSRGFEMSF